MRQPWTSEDGIVVISDDEDSTQATHDGKISQLITQPSTLNPFADDPVEDFHLSQRPTFQSAASQTRPCKLPRSQLPENHRPISILGARKLSQDQIETTSPIKKPHLGECALRTQASSPWAGQHDFRPREKAWEINIDPLVAYTSANPSSSGASSSSEPTSHGSKDANDVALLSRSAHSVGSHGDYPIDLTEGYADDISKEDFSTREHFHRWVTQQRQKDMGKGSTGITGSSLRIESLNLPLRPMRNLPIATPLQRLSEYTHKGIKLNPKANVELSDGDFMRIVDVIMNPATGDVHLRGWVFRRTKSMNGILERKYNEICWILHVDEDDARDINIQAMESVPVTQVVRRRKIRLTNQAFPTFSFREDGMRDDEQTILNEWVLVCRYKYICSYASAKMREQYRWSEKSLQRLRADECDRSLAKNDEELRYDWRGWTEKGGACASISAEEKDFRQQEYQRQENLRATAEDSVLSDKSSEHDGLASVDTEFGDLHTLSSQAHEELVKMPNPIQKATKSIIDLTDSDRDPCSSDWSDLWSRRSSNRVILLPSISKSGSPVVIDIDATIETITRLDTVQKENPGQVTTNFVPHQLSSSKRKHPDDRTSIPANQSKRSRTHLEPQGPSHCSDSGVSSRAFSRSDGKRCRDTRTGRVSYKNISPESIIASNDDIQKTQAPDRILTPSPETFLSSPPAQNNRDHSNAPSDTQHLTTRPLSSRSYTLGDCFCGAIQANLRIAWAFDSNTHACSSYALNNPHTTLYPYWAHDFCCSLTSRTFKVDICHLSPPCQFFSDAHTIMGKDDDMNTASLFAISELIKKCTPRVVTLEQTSGLLRRHEIYFNAVVLMFTALGFSVRWRVLNCADYGVPQRRMRVFVIASWYAASHFPLFYFLDPFQS